MTINLKTNIKKPKKKKSLLNNKLYNMKHNPNQQPSNRYQKTTYQMWIHNLQPTPLHKTKAHKTQKILLFQQTTKHHKLKKKSCHEIRHISNKKHQNHKSQRKPQKNVHNAPVNPQPIPKVLWFQHFHHNYNADPTIQQQKQTILVSSHKLLIPVKHFNHIYNTDL